MQRHPELSESRAKHRAYMRKLRDTGAPVYMAAPIVQEVPEVPQAPALEPWELRTPSPENDFIPLSQVPYTLNLSQLQDSVESLSDYVSLNDSDGAETVESIEGSTLDLLNIEKTE